MRRQRARPVALVLGAPRHARPAAPGSGTTPRCRPPARLPPLPPWPAATRSCPHFQASGLTVATHGSDLAVRLHKRKGKQGAVSQLLSIGNCQVQTDKASMLDDGIEYLKHLQLQVPSKIHLTSTPYIPLKHQAYLCEVTLGSRLQPPHSVIEDIVVLEEA